MAIYESVIDKYEYLFNTNENVQPLQRKPKQKKRNYFELTVKNQSRIVFEAFNGGSLDNVRNNDNTYDQKLSVISSIESIFPDFDIDAKYLNHGAYKINPIYLSDDLKELGFNVVLLGEEANGQSLDINFSLVDSVTLEHALMILETYLDEYLVYFSKNVNRTGSVLSRGQNNPLYIIAMWIYLLRAGLGKLEELKPRVILMLSLRSTTPLHVLVGLLYSETSVNKKVFDRYTKDIDLSKMIIDQSVTVDRKKECDGDIVMEKVNLTFQKVGFYDMCGMQFIEDATLMVRKPIQRTRRDAIDMGALKLDD